MVNYLSFRKITSLGYMSQTNAEVVSEISYLLCGQKVTKNRRLEKKG
jgi:hypothetical protein